jgi:ATP-dependent Clp protease ATP-binding subunit ClpA
MNQDKFSSDLLAGIQAAIQLALAQRAPELFTVHLLAALSAQSDTVFIELLKKNKVDTKAFHASLAARRTFLPRLMSAPEKILPSSECIAILDATESEMKLFDDTTLSTISY